MPVPVATMMNTALGSSGISSTLPVGPAHGVEQQGVARLIYIFTTGTCNSLCTVQLPSPEQHQARLQGQMLSRQVHCSSLHYTAAHRSS